jgi:hypothetical protein
MKAVITFISGFLGILFFEGFARLIITFYHRIEFQFYGISHFPSDVWIYVIFASVITSTWLATMLVLTILENHQRRNAVIFGVIIVLWRVFEIANSYQDEAAWYFGGVIGLHILAISLAYVVYKRQSVSSLSNKI